MVPGSQAPSTVLWCIVICIFALASFFAYIACFLNNVRFEIEPQGLRIKAAMYGRLIPARSLVKENIKVLDLNKDEFYRPQSRTNGMSLPGYHTGWYVLRNKEKALLFLTDQSKVVYVPTGDGYSLLMSVQDADDFISELKK